MKSLISGETKEQTTVVKKKNYEYFINVNLLQVVTVPWLRTDFVNNYALCDKSAKLGGHKQQPISLRGCFETDCHL